MKAKGSGDGTSGSGSFWHENHALLRKVELESLTKRGRRGQKIPKQSLDPGNSKEATRRLPPPGGGALKGNLL